MKAEDEVCNLRQAKKLVELNVILNTKYQWFRTKTNFLLIEGGEMSENFIEKEIQIPAPDIDELKNILKNSLPDDVNIHIADMDDDGYWLYVDCLFKGFEGFFKTEAEALCGVLIWLVESGHLKASELEL